MQSPVPDKMPDIAFANRPNNNTNGQVLPPPIDPQNRAVHTIRLKALSHNYVEVEAAANKQRCSVIVVVKADGYGHGAIATALFLADYNGADAFAVATLEEGIALRKAFVNTPPGGQIVVPSVAAGEEAPATSVAFLFQPQQEQQQQQQQLAGSIIGSTPDLSVLTSTNQSTAFSVTTSGSGGTINNHHNANQRRALSSRAPQIRILVLGAPVGVPRCFDEYLHHTIEVMISGPEVALSLLEWVANKDERKHKQVERAAAEAKSQALLFYEQKPPQERLVPATGGVMKRESSNTSNITHVTVTTGYPSNESTGKISQESQDGAVIIDAPSTRCHPPSATLSNVTGQDLAKEVRLILQNQHLVLAQKQHQQQQSTTTTKASLTPPGSRTSSIQSNMSEWATVGINNDKTPSVASNGGSSTTTAPAVQTRAFGGIEAAAKNSRTMQKAKTFHANHQSANGGSSNSDNQKNAVRDPSSRTAHNLPQPQTSMESTKPTRIPTPHSTVLRKRLRWHALVDSGMGRLGFRAESSDTSEERDTVDILSELADLENDLDCPIEFFGMCTHMAEASSESTYTNDQIRKFRELLERVRGAAHISVPTISTDNSAALLTTTLNHFDPKQLLAQPESDSRGFVRTGGAIYGQRPAFSQLRAVSTLMASVRHVAVLKEGDSVGYDRAYIAPHNVRIATLAIGFADGYPRELGNRRGQVCINDNLYPVVGKVCMDMMMVDLGPAGDKHGAGSDVVVGDTAILWGPADDDDGEGRVRLQDVADKLKTTQSALTCGLNKERVLRRYEG